MKRFVLITALIICSFFMCFADTPTEVYLYDNAAGSLPIYAHMDNYWVIAISRITHGGGTVGMDFDLMGDDVSYNSADENLGRLIAYWTFIVNVNVPWRLKVNASPLTLEGGNGSTVINYHLTFNMDYQENGDLVSRDWKINSSGNPEAYYYFPYNDGSYSTDEVSSSFKQIRFMLENYTEEEKFGWEEGKYYSTVSLILESE